MARVRGAVPLLNGQPVPAGVHHHVDHPIPVRAQLRWRTGTEELDFGRAGTDDPARPRPDRSDHDRDRRARLEEVVRALPPVVEQTLAELRTLGDVDAVEVQLETISAAAE